jgi:hypothetical protein
MLTSTWTAFEALAGDLWEAAVNVRSDRFADLGGIGDRIQKEAEMRGSRVVSNKDPLANYINNAKKKGKKYRKRRGTRYRDNGTVSFDTLPKIRAAYSWAFKAPSAGIDDALCDPSLEVLVVVRNLLAHKAGTCDRRYVNDARAVPGCPRVGRGKQFPLRGDVVANLIKPVVGAAMRLIAAVDAEVL